MHVPCPVLVGRSHEVEVLTAALDAARTGRGELVFVVGEAGIGKSRLVQETTARAVDRGMRVLRGRAVPGSGATAFRPLTEAVAQAAPEARSLADLSSWLPALGAILPSLTSAEPVDVTTPVRGEAVLRLLSEVCARGGLLVLEDLHWADPETVAIVEHLIDNLGRTPVLGVVTVRSDEDSAARELVGRVTARRGAPVLQLERLNEAQVSAMVFSCAGDADPDVVERVVSLGEGVPFLVEEMLVSPGLPASFVHGVQARLAELSERERRVLVTAAAFGRHFDWRWLPTAAGSSDGEVVDALERGLAVQLLAVEDDGFRFRHALTAEAVFQSVTPPRRQAFAAAALAALSDAGGEVPVEAREVGARVAERAGEAQRAGRLHLALGEDALGRGALQTAMLALKQATGLLRPGEARDAASQLLVYALVEIGLIDDAVAVADQLVARLPADRAAHVHMRVAAGAAIAARWDVAADHLAAARPSIGARATPALQAELALLDGEVALGTGDRPRAEKWGTTALTLATQHDLGEAECAALQLLGRHARPSSLEVAEVWFQRAASAADAHDLAVWRLRAQHELGTIALLSRSEVDPLLQAQRLAESLGAMATAAILDIEIAAGYAGTDDFEGEARHGEQAIRRGGELGLGLVVAWGWQHVAAIAALRGDDERADAARSAARAAAPDNRDIEGFLIGGRLLAALAADELERALDLASRMTEILRGSPSAPPAHYRAAWPVLLALAGRPEAAAAIEETGAAGVSVVSGGRAWLRVAEAILLGRTDGERAAALAAEADADQVHMPLWRSLARRLAAEAACNDGWQVPGGWLTEAEVTLRRLGFHRPADACRRLRGGEPDAVPPAWVELGITRREADVLLLVVEGWSNREIAERLYLSVRTVEKHVESLLRRTASKNRTQLVHAVANT